ncbi:hypothetical protein [Clostridium algidicarnis]|uniref:hypothetical protein n=1 Tax=Clostridium algidicarnis TaxID=37659 RepID=UPI001C0D437B|nr:hypothetical protein [Clostridium algidicarnis]MBU3227784.1 hypothetical protein [Clostridium algidicarnis]MBU3251535.1 hypothetical protein [Clostridium algidicarnis]
MRENELRSYLKNLGASMVGFADLSIVNTSLNNNMKYGIEFARLFVLYEMNDKYINKITD